MAPLFGPLATSGANRAASLYGAPQYAPAPVYSGLAPTSLSRMTKLRSPVWPTPAVRIGDLPTMNQWPVGVVGTPSTYRDRLFGPFASLVAGAGGPSGL